MTYATQLDMTERFGEQEVIQLTDRDGTGAIVTAVLDAALADADSMIDGYLATRYTLPLASPPTVLARIACDLARYYLYDDKAPPQVAERYQAAVAFLKSVSRGEVTLGVPAVTDGAATGTAEMQSGGRVFGRDQGHGFI